MGVPLYQRSPGFNSSWAKKARYMADLPSLSSFFCSGADPWGSGQRAEKAAQKIPTIDHPYSRLLTQGDSDNPEVKVKIYSP